MGTPIKHYKLDFFEQDSEELYYFLGFIASDGYITDERIEIYLNIKDEAIIKKFVELICPDATIKYDGKTNSCGFTIYNKVLAAKYKKFFSMTTNKKAFELRFPLIPINYIKDFIRGYIDGDGCIDTTKSYRNNKAYVGPRLRILGNYEFLKTLNEVTKVFVHHNTNAIAKKGKENVYYVAYNFSTAERLLEWLYKDSKISLERKYNKAINLIGYRETINNVA